MHDNPYRAEEGEAASQPKPRQFVRRIASVTILTVAAIFGIPLALRLMLESLGYGPSLPVRPWSDKIIAGSIVSALLALGFWLRHGLAQ